MEAQTLEKLKQMLNVPIDKVEEKGEELVVYVPKGQVARAIGAGGSVIRSAELILKRKLTIKEST
ncbi:MAG: transcription elongation factor NusA [Candidatus Hadarchaeaceae archaeon]